MDSNKSELQIIKDRYEKAIEQGNLINLLTGNEGWKFFVTWIEATVRRLELTVMTGTGTPAETARAQGEWSAYRNILAAVGNFDKVGQKAKVDLEQLTTANKEELNRLNGTK